MKDQSVIRPLPPDVIKKIAAGEIIVRPSSALKELIENSIDAGSTEIRVNLSTNPLDFCEIADNGSGVSEKDLLIICKRFTTSKTRNTIEGVKSLGFRGEALSSLSQSAHVTISSRTENAPRRTVVRYLECKPLMEEITHEDGPRGFYLKYENLFYNYETRYKSLASNTNSEFNSCLQLVQKYSIHFTNINFVFNKVNSNVSQLNTKAQDLNQERVLSDQRTQTDSQTSEDSSPKEDKSDFDYHFFKEVYPKLNENSYEDPLLKDYMDKVYKKSMNNLKLVKQGIKNVYGLYISNTLHEVVFNKFDELFFNCKALISHPNQSSKLEVFTLFINNRLVELAQLRNMIYNSYNEISNNKHRRFVYISIFLPYDKIDANVHPSKKKVVMDDQAELVHRIADCLADKINELMKMTNPTSSFETSNTKLIEDYKINKESIPNKFKTRTNAKQTNISHFVTPLFSVSSTQEDRIKRITTDTTDSDKDPYPTDFSQNKEDSGNLGLFETVRNSKLGSLGHSSNNSRFNANITSHSNISTTTKVTSNISSDFIRRTVNIESLFDRTSNNNNNDNNKSNNNNDTNNNINNNNNNNNINKDSNNNSNSNNITFFSNITRNASFARGGNAAINVSDNTLTDFRYMTPEDLSYQNNTNIESYIYNKDDTKDTNDSNNCGKKKEEEEEIITEELDQEDILDDPNIIEKYDYDRIRVEKLNKIKSFSYNSIRDPNTLGNIYEVKEVQKMIDQFVTIKDHDLTQLVLNSSYVGTVDKTYILVQHKNNLVMMNILLVAKECCYQSIIWRLNNIPSFKLTMRIPLKKLFSHCLRKHNLDTDVESLIDTNLIKVLNVLFGFHIEDLFLRKLPNLLNGYFPGQEYIADLLYALFTIKHSSLNDLVHQVANTLSYYYTQPPMNIIPQKDIDSNYENFMSRVLFSPCQKFQDLAISQKFNSNGVFIKLANINLLYRIFERC